MIPSIQTVRAMSIVDSDRANNYEFTRLPAGTRIIYCSAGKLTKTEAEKYPEIFQRGVVLESYLNEGGGVNSFVAFDSGERAGVSAWRLQLESEIR